jgi:hypothetical protein
MYNAAAGPSGYRPFNEYFNSNTDSNISQHQYWGQQPTTTFNANFGSDTDFSATGPPETEFTASSGFNDVDTDIGSSVSQHWEQPPVTANYIAQLTHRWITQGDTNPRPETVTQRTEDLLAAFDNQDWNFTQHTNHPLAPHQHSRFSTLSGWNVQPTAQPQPNTINQQHTQAQQSQPPSTHQHNTTTRSQDTDSSNQSPSRPQRIAAAQQEAEHRQKDRQQREYDGRE